MKQKLITITVIALIITFTGGAYFFTKRTPQFIQVPQPFLTTLHDLNSKSATILQDYESKLKSTNTKEEYQNALNERTSISEQINKVYLDVQKDVITSLVKDGVISPKHIDNYVILFTPKKNFILSYFVPTQTPEDEKLPQKTETPKDPKEGK